MDSLYYFIHRDSLSISLRVMRIMLSALLCIGLLTETMLTVFWQLLFSILALYTFMTGVFGRDSLFAILRHAKLPTADYSLDAVARVECLSIGLICIIAGIVYHHVDSLVFRILPFLGIYPVLLCVVKHDLLGYLLQSYRKDLHSRN